MAPKKGDKKSKVVTSVTSGNQYPPHTFLSQKKNHRFFRDYIQLLPRRILHDFAVFSGSGAGFKVQESQNSARRAEF